jgi:hypothetical protein
MQRRKTGSRRLWNPERVRKGVRRLLLTLTEDKRKEGEPGTEKPSMARSVERVPPSHLHRPGGDVRSRRTEGPEYGRQKVSSMHGILAQIMGYKSGKQPIGCGFASI